MNSQPYSKLAQIYDKVMDHVDYKMWSNYVENLFNYTNNKITRILDLACGTGKHIQYICPANVSVIGADFSLAMLKQATLNLAKDTRTRLAVSDASMLSFKNGQFDIVVMLYDSINYIMDENRVAQLLNEVNRVLIPGGIFIFDFVTKAGLKTSFEDHFETNSWDGFAYERHCWFSTRDQIQHNDFYLLYEGKSFKEEHIQKIRSLDEWKNIILKSDMHLNQEFSNFSFSQPTRRSERIHMVCMKDKG